MGKPVYTESLGPSHRKGVENLASVFDSGDGVVTLMTSSKSTGVSKSGKPWTSYRNEEIYYFSWRRGPMRVYNKSRVSLNHGMGPNRTKMGPLRDDTAESLWRLDMASHRSDEDVRVRTSFGALHRSGVSAPFDRLRSDYPLIDVARPKPVVTPFLTAENPVELARRILGKNYQKPVARALGALMDGNHKEQLSNSILMTMLLQGIVPADWIPRVLEGASRSLYRVSPFRSREDLRYYRSFLKTASEPQLRRITSRDLHELVQAIREVPIDLENLEAGQQRLDAHEFTSLIGLHQDFIDARNRAYREQYRDYARPTPSSYDIAYQDKALEFAKEYDGFTVVAPEGSNMLREWSNYMNNCISSYASQASAGYTLLYGVTQGDKLIANIELNPKTGDVKQLLGKYNQSVPAEMSDKIKAAINQTWPDAVVDQGWQ